MPRRTGYPVARSVCERERASEREGREGREKIGRMREGESNEFLAALSLFRSNCERMRKRSLGLKYLFFF